LNDASAGKLAFRDGSSDLLTVQKGTGNAYIKGTISTSSIGASITGTPKSDSDAVVLTNQANAADMADTRVSLSFKQWYYDSSSPAAAHMAKFTAGAESDWTATASSQNAYLGFNVANGGTLTERIRITSGGNVGIGTNAPEAKLSVAGGVVIQEDLTVGGASSTGARAVTIRSGDNTAALSVTSTGGTATATVQAANSTAQVAVRAGAGQDAKLTLTQGSTAFSLLHRGSDNTFAVNDGTNDVFTVAHSTSDATLRGGLTVGGGPGARAITVKSTNGSAALEVSAASSGTASISATAATGQNSKVVFASGSSKFELVNDAASDKLKITDGSSELLSIARNGGALHAKGALTVGTGSAAAAATIKSTGGAATLSVVSSASTATALISSAAGSDASLALQQGATSFKIINRAASSKLVFTDGANDLLSISRTNGGVATRGDVTVGGSTSSGAKAISVTSSDGAASVAVQSGGASAASMSITAPSGQDASLTLTESTGKSWHLKSDATNNALKIGEGSNDWLSIADNGAAIFSGDLTTEGNLAVGTDTSLGTKQLYLKSPDDLAKLTVTGAEAKMIVEATGSAADAVITVKAQSGRSAGLTLQELSGGATFYLINDGANDMFKIRDATNNLLTMAAGSGDMSLRGGLNVKSGKLVVDSTSGYVGVHGTPSVAMHVNGSMKVESGDFTVSAGQDKATLFVQHESGFIGVNNYAPSEAIHVKGNVKIEPDAAGRGGHLFANKGAVHFRYNNAAQGAIDREYYMASSQGVTLPTDTRSTCTSNCAPKASRLYIIRNKSGSGTIIVSASVSVPIRKNGAAGDMNAGAAMSLLPNGMAYCAFDTAETRYDCWTWNE